MDSLLMNFSRQLNDVFLLALVLAALAAAIVLLLASLAARRAWRHLRTKQFDALSFKIHERWREMVRGEIPPEEWCSNSLQCEILQSIVIQEIGAVTDKDRAGLQDFLRKSGLLDRCIDRVYNGHGWGRRRAMLALGAMQVPEAIPPLAELLDDWQLDTRLAAVQALGRTGLAEAAEPILETHMVGGLKVPSDPLTNALMRCYAERPTALLPFLRRSLGESRELIARVASELATPAMADEMILLAEDPNPEVRASAAKALAAAHLPVAIPALAILIGDGVWFVRLRAVSALNGIPHPRTIPLLLEAICDSNRLVRIRAAAALSKFEHETTEILQSIVDSRDRYALHAMISALELGGGFKKVMAQLTDPALHNEAAARLVEALREGSASLWSTRPADPVVESVFP
jgi:HEAT repeat protein